MFLLSIHIAFILNSFLLFKGLILTLQSTTNKSSLKKKVTSRAKLYYISSRQYTGLK